MARPPSARSARRRASQRRPESIGDLRLRAGTAPLAGLDNARADRARRVLVAWLDSCKRHGRAFEDVLRELATGVAATQIGEALRAETMKAPPPQVRDADCAAGCAFCCILDGPDGGTITQSEARGLHAALAPLAGMPDGRGWHPAACPSLDPETRSCRAYEARPTICRSYLSTDATACETNAAGGMAEGAGLLGSHLDYLAVHLLARAVLAGTVRVDSYALREVAAATVDGCDLRETLKRARHPERTLKDAARGAVSAAAAAG